MLYLHLKRGNAEETRPEDSAHNRQTRIADGGMTAPLFIRQDSRFQNRLQTPALTLQLWVPQRFFRYLQVCFSVNMFCHLANRRHTFYLIFLPSVAV